jgi:hypothetical protein
MHAFSDTPGGIMGNMKFLLFMNTSVGRVIRVAMGIAVFCAGALVGGGLGTGLMVFAFLPVLTGVTGVCPLNPLTGQPLRACATKKTSGATDLSA